jgi:hypothetical protein
MRDYWLTKDLLQAAGIGFLLLAAIGIGLALWLPKKWWGKFLGVLAVGFVISIPLYKTTQETQQQQAVVNDHKERLAKAQALFDERCKTAGEKIYKTVEGVGGILLVNPRPDRSNADRANRDWLGAGFPGESGGNQYIMEFLYFNKPQSGLQGRELGWVRGGLKGYPYVDVDDQGKHFRYRLRAESEYVYGSDPLKAYGKRELVADAFPRYAISYENINDPLGRANWIAGGRVTVIDQKNGELLGEFVRYSFEAGFGDTYGERSPWGFAKQCPLTNYGGASGHIRSFVERVVKPGEGE